MRGILGQGGYGRVYRAYDPDLERWVALKIPTFAASDTGKTKRFHSEAKAAAQLRHPNIVPTFESGRIGEQFYIASQFIDGEPLSAVIKARRVSYSDAVVWVLKIAQALAYAHEMEIVHRDVKPHNIMLDERGEPQLMDFGLAKRLNEDSGMTADGALLGTPAYMAPEQARGEMGIVGPASDQYAVGAVLYELLTGRRAFEGSPHSVIGQILSKDPITPRAIDAEIPRDLEAITLKAMSREIPDRYRDCHELSADLENWLRGDATIARPVTRLELLIRWSKRNRALAMALGGTILAVSLLGVLGVVFAGYQIRASRLIMAEQQKTMEALKTANAERDRAEAQQQKADEQTKIAEGRLAEVYLQHGQHLCQSGELEEGLLRMVRALEKTPQGSQSLEQNIRAGLSGWQVKLRPLICSVQHDGNVSCASFHPRMESVITGCWDGTARFWSLASCQPIGPPLSVGPRITDVIYRKDGELAAVAAADGTVHFVDPATGEKRGENVKFDGPVLALRFDSDNQTLIVGTARSVHSIVPGEPRSQSVMVTLDTDAKFIDISPKNDIILVGAGAHVQPWNLRTGKKVGPGLQHPRSIQCASASPTERVVVSGNLGDSKTRLWNIDTGTVIHEFIGGNLPTLRTAWSEDGTMLSTANQDGTVMIWNKDLTVRGDAIRHRSPVNAISFSADGKFLITGCRDGTARVWDIQAKDGYRHQLSHSAIVRAIGFRHDGLRVASGTSDGHVCIWDVSSGEQVGTPLAHGALVNAITYSPNGKIIASGGIDHITRIWDADTLQVRRMIQNSSQVYQIAFLPDGETILCAAGGYPDAPNGVAEFRNIQTGEPVGKPLGHNGGVQCVALTPDGATAVTGSLDNTARVWDVQSRSQRGEDLKHDGYVLAVAISTDGQLVLTGSRDFTARLWNAKTGESIGKILQHSGSVWGVAFSANTKLIVTACDDGGARIWDRETGRQIGPAFRHQGMVAAVSFTPDGKMLATGGADHFLRTWNVPVPLQGSAASLALYFQVSTGRELNANDSVQFLGGDEWQRYLKDLGTSGLPVK